MGQSVRYLQTLAVDLFLKHSTKAFYGEGFPVNTLNTKLLISKKHL